MRKELRNDKSESSPLKTASYIRRVFIQQLFGRYTYDLHLDDPTRSAESSRLLILYGDNGSGKTTILQMIFHLLNPARKGGHRSFIARQLFRQFIVELTDGVRVTAQRAGETLDGSYKMTIGLPNGKFKELDWIASPEGKVTGAEQGLKEEVEFMKYLAGLNIALYFLSDNRKISTTHQNDQFDDASSEYVALRAHEQTWRMARHPEDFEEKSREAAIELTVFRASNWATQQVLRASTKGDEDANAIFTNIVKRIVRHHGKRDAHSRQVSKTKLIEELRALERRSLDFSRFGLIAITNISSLINSIEDAQQDALSTISDVIKPYADSLTARLNAFQKVHDSMEAFAESVNSFFHDKKVDFFIGKGLNITTTEGKTISPTALSSGERQLLLLFSNLLVASKQNSIFIVDEPELSLNVKWQRQLIKHLFDFTQGTSVQFVFATHSIELLSRYKHDVVRLTPLSQALPS